MSLSLFAVILFVLFINPVELRDPLNCSKFDDDEDFVIFYDGERTVNSSALFFCKDMNKNLEGSSIVICLPNGNWSDDPPKCESSPIVNCPKFDDMDLLILYENGQAVNSIALFFCKDKRKKLHGRSVATCLPNGQWSSDPPECKMRCPWIEATEVMTVFYTKNLDEGSIAAFLCSYPHTRSGVVSTTCQANGEWTDPPPKCIISDPGCSLEKLFDILPENVVPVVDDLTSDTLPFNISLNLIHKNNMTLTGTDAVYCGGNGTWKLSKAHLRCFVDELSFPGLIKGTKLFYLPGQNFTVTCESGFNVTKENNQLTCENGAWKGHLPPCIAEAQCDQPVAPEHGTVQVIGDKSNVGSTALYTCDEGRVLVGSTSSKCLDIGEWTFPTPRCLEPCFIPKVEHGKIGRKHRRRMFEELSENSKIEDSEELYLRCEPNYEPFGHPETEEKINCSDGEWETLPICKPAMCRGPPPSTQNAVMLRANRNHGGGVVYFCRLFTKVVKYGIVTCVFGTWKGDPPVCKDFRCFVDELSFPGLIKGTKLIYLPGQNFTVTCESGFNVTKENNQLSCENGAWKGHLPPCIAGSCTIHRIGNGGFSKRVMKKHLNWDFTSDRWFEYPRLRLGVRSARSRIYVSCNDGYSFQGNIGENNVLVKCVKGKWEPDPVCLISTSG